MAAKPSVTLSCSSGPSQLTVDWPGWSAAIIGGVTGGMLIGSNGYHAVIAGAAIALLVTLTARTRPTGKALVGDVLAVGVCVVSITLDRWWQAGYVSGHTLLHIVRAGIMLLLMACGAGAVVRLLACAVRRAVAARIGWSRPAVPSGDGY